MQLHPCLLLQGHCHLSDGACVSAASVERGGGLNAPVTADTFSGDQRQQETQQTGSLQQLPCRLHAAAAAAAAEAAPKAEETWEDIAERTGLTADDVLNR